MELLREPKDGEGIDARGTMYPCRLEVLRAARNVGAVTSSVYGFVLSGRAELRAPGLEVRADAGAFFCVAGEARVEPVGAAVVVAIERFGFRGQTIVGRVEAAGRLAYIDGCSDSILVSPPRLGDPVLNHLHFPAGIRQSPHIHPSIRLGVVARGEGVAYGPGDPGWEEPLTPGCVFLLHGHELHAFRTGAQELDVIAFHPDSDWGPTDAAHPMRNRTYVR